MNGTTTAATIRVASRSLTVSLRITVTSFPHSTMPGAGAGEKKPTSRQGRTTSRHVPAPAAAPPSGLDAVEGGDGAAEGENDRHAWQSGCMLIEHRSMAPQVHPTAYVAPTAVVCGAVRIGADARILFGAVLTAEDGEIQIGERTVVMENALVRGRAGHPAIIGSDVLVGPHAHL